MDLNGKRVLVVGLGKSGLASAHFLKAKGAVVTATDSRSAELLGDVVPQLLEQGIAVEAGEHALISFQSHDLVVISPGVSVDTPQLVQARALGIPILGEVELASRFLAGKMLAITGSNGKTTTTTLAGKILTEASLPTQVGGNIGLPVVELIANSTPETWNVLEISSFQLETAVTFHPQIAVILNITPDHLDRHGSFVRYIAEKEKIFAQQTAEDFLILNADDKTTQMAAGKTKSQVFWFSASRPHIKRGAFVHKNVVVFVAQEGGVMEPILPVVEIPLKGQHNVENVLAAVCAARLAGVSAENIRESVKSFTAVAHRLQFVATINGVDYFNDSKATNVDATMKALASFERGVHLILGGKDKDSDYTLLAPLLRERVAAVYTIGSAAEKIARQLAGVSKIVEAGTLDKAMHLASASAQSNDVVLLAPACASFDQFQSYEQRGRVFTELVLAMKK